MTDQEAKGFVAFDLEIAKELPDDREDWLEARPLGISCAATLVSDGHLVLWHGGEGPDYWFADRMRPELCSGLATYLALMQTSGFPIITYNGLGFDFDILAEECQSDAVKEIIITLALEHIDIAFNMLCEKGFMIGLDTAAKGMGLPGKIKGMRGDLAPKMWKQGRKAQDKVLEYVAQDVYTTAELFMRIQEKKRLTWISQSGRPNYWQLSKGKILSVCEALVLPEPDTSWMTKSWPRSKFYGWTEATEESPSESSRVKGEL